MKDFNLEQINTLQYFIDNSVAKIERGIQSILDSNEKIIDFRFFNREDYNELGRDFTYILEQLVRVENVVKDIDSRYKKALEEQ